MVTTLKVPSASLTSSARAQPLYVVTVRLCAAHLPLVEHSLARIDREHMTDQPRQRNSDRAGPTSQVQGARRIVELEGVAHISKCLRSIGRAKLVEVRGLRER